MKYDDVTTDPIWRTAAILKMVISLYLSWELSDFNEIWYAHVNYAPRTVV